MDHSLDTISPLTLEDQVLERLREAILEGVFLPGSQLNQAQIAAQFGVSRGPVRAAVNKLEKDGLVRNVPHRGTYVTHLDKKTVSDLYSVRAVLEAYGVRLAVAHCTPEDIEEFSEIVDEMRAAAYDGDVEKVVRLDSEVHEFFIRLSDNSFLLQTWSTIKVQVRRALAFRHHSHPDIQDIADSHLPFISLMRQKNADEAARVMEAHIHDALHDLMQRWH